MRPFSWSVSARVSAFADPPASGDRTACVVERG